MDYTISLLSAKDIEDIVPLIEELNAFKASKAILHKRFEEMFTQSYECVGVFDQDKLVGVAGLWFQTRHYSGKSCEADHVFLQQTYRNKGIGEKLFDFIIKHAKAKGCEAVELNTYVQNTASHKFYYNQDFSILGFHFLKQL